MLDRGECTFWFFLSLQMFVTSASLPFRKFNNLLHLLRFGGNNIPIILIFITATIGEMALVANLLVQIFVWATEVI